MGNLRNCIVPRLAGALLFACLMRLSPVSGGPATAPAIAPTTAPATAPSDAPAGAADATMDWLFDQSAPASKPAAALATAPTTQLAEAQPGWRDAVLTLSDGTILRGRVASTAGKPLRLWDESIKDYHDVPLALIKKIAARVLWERMEDQWHFTDSGSDRKEYSGKQYPARMTEYIVTLQNGQKIQGQIVAPLYFENDALQKTFALHKRDKGALGQTLERLIYVRAVEFP